MLKQILTPCTRQLLAIHTFGWSNASACLGMWH